jgi:CDP-diacylglycerol--serine O-phosphatidyltransferase
MLMGTALLLVSTFPVWSFKNFKVPSALVLPLLLGVGLYAAFLVADPWLALALGGIVYVGMLPFSARSYRRLKAEAEAETGANGEGTPAWPGTAVRGACAGPGIAQAPRCSAIARSIRLADPASSSGLRRRRCRSAGAAMRFR